MRARGAEPHRKLLSAGKAEAMPAQHDWEVIISGIGSRGYVEAVGAIACLYNQLEYTFYGLFYCYSGVSHASARSLFLGINNPFRQSHFRRLVEECDEKEAVKELLHCFADSYEICVTNRNLLMHAWMQGGDEEPLHVLKFSRRRAPDFEALNLTTGDLRDAARDMFWLQMYGQTLVGWVNRSPEDRITSLDLSCEGLPLQRWPLPRLLTVSN